MQVHILSFEGPDPYAMAGGIGSRVSGLASALVERGFETHVWFVGDPNKPGHEVEGLLHLHRWCQWISAHHPHGVYDGQAEKAEDYAASLPPYLMREHLLPTLKNGNRVVVLAEEWQTAHCVMHLHHLLLLAGLRNRVTMLWNANNTFGFDALDWQALAKAAHITTVSRYMKQLMHACHVDPLVFPNGLSPQSYVRPDNAATSKMRHATKSRVVLFKMARFDPDKRWLWAMDAAAMLKAEGMAPLLVARGGMEGYGQEVLEYARGLGLRITGRGANSTDPADVVDAVTSNVAATDVLVLDSRVDEDARRVLLCGSDAVLANSSHEPFGLVGLETMAAGGVACTGYTGEDYANPGRNALVLQTSDPREFAGLFGQLRQDPGFEKKLRYNGTVTAAEYAWSEILMTTFLPRMALLGALRWGGRRAARA